MKPLILLTVAAAPLLAQTQFDVIRENPLWFNQQGVLRVDEDQLCFTPKGDDEKPRCWAYEDIQHLSRLGPDELTVLTYEDVAWKLGRDRSYNFELTSGAISDDLFDRMVERIGKPATDAVVDEPIDAEAALPAKHLKTFGGSEGEIYISPERIIYATDAEEESREWFLDRDVASVWSSDPYRLEVYVYEGNPAAFQQPNAYKFALKRPLDPGLYRRLKLRLYEIDRERDLNP